VGEALQRRLSPWAARSRDGGLGPCSRPPSAQAKPATAASLPRRPSQASGLAAACPAPKLAPTAELPLL